MRKASSALLKAMMMLYLVLWCSVPNARAAYDETFVKGPYRNVMGGSSYTIESMCFDATDYYELAVGGKLTVHEDGSTHGILYTITPLFNRIIFSVTLDNLISGVVAVKTFNDWQLLAPKAFAVGYTSPTKEVLFVIDKGNDPGALIMARKFTVPSGERILPQSGLLVSWDASEVYLLSET